jgi:hypothetical protein
MAFMLKTASLPSYFTVLLVFTGIPILAVSEFLPKLYSPYRDILPARSPAGAHLRVVFGGSLADWENTVRKSRERRERQQIFFIFSGSGTHSKE